MFVSFGVTFFHSRAKVLRHHPDKRRALGEEIKEGDDYFTCITKAAEILSNPIKRYEKISQPSIVVSNVLRERRGTDDGK